MRIASWSVAFALALVVASSGAATESVSVEQIHIGPPHRSLHAVRFDGSAGYAVGDRGRVLRSDDGGQTWSEQDSPTDLSLLAVAARGPFRLAVGQTGLALRFDGTAWSTVDTGTQERLMGVDVDADGRAVGVGSFGAMLRSDDGGAHWTRVEMDWPSLVEGGFEPHLYAVQALGDGVFVAVGEYGLVLRSSDGGAHWAKLHGGDASLFAVHIRADGVGYAVGQSGSVLKTVDHGQSWAPQPSGTDANLLGVWSAQNGRVVVAGMRQLLLSADDGVSWQRDNDGDLGRIWISGTGAPAGGDAAVVVGQSERIFRVGSHR